jgi:hypothetical protein
MYNLPYAYVYALPDMRRITLVLMHILIELQVYIHMQDFRRCWDSHATNSIIFAEQKVKSSFSISQYHDHKLTPSTAYTEYSIHRVQHTPSTAYTEYSIHRVKHTPKIVCLPLIHMISSWQLNVASASAMPPYTIDHHQPALHARSNVKSPCHNTPVAS